VEKVSKKKAKLAKPEPKQKRPDHRRKLQQLENLVIKETSLKKNNFLRLDHIRITPYAQNQNKEVDLFSHKLKS